MRYLKLMLVLFLALTIAAPQAEAARKHRNPKRTARTAVVAGTSDPRYADLIMNPVTGEVYHSNDADARRYPASLTKMMTLYMLFEALEQRRTTMEARLDVSDYAASMPQTNLALTPGDSMPVETVIKALVVRSANDVAVVVAEALGGDVDHFGQMMTAKARQLGMRNTVFKNPNGLPNPGQYTTARDMAKLGIALKRDFPQYFPYFSTRQFSWDGVTYYTHNRVMLRYAGTDGIKTGYTGAAGFNLVTSVTRGGRPIVGVVMGGMSGAWRDNRMIQLLDGTYKELAERGGVKGKVYAANLPLAKNGQKVGVGISSAAVMAENAPEMFTTKEDASPLNVEEAEDGAPNNTAVGDISSNDVPAVASAQVKTPAATLTATAVPVTTTITPTPSANAPQPSASVAPAAASATSKLPPNSPFALASITPNAPRPAAAPAPTARVSTAATAPTAAAKPTVTVINNPGWGIQVGAFSSHELAEQSVKQAQQLAPDSLRGASSAIAGPVANGAPVHRARLESLSQTQAKKACSTLISNNLPCFIYKAEPEKI